MGHRSKNGRDPREKDGHFHGMVGRRQIQELEV